MQWTSRLRRRCAVGYATKNGAQFYEEEDSFSENIFSIDSKEFDVNGVKRRGFFCKSLNTPGEPIQLTNEQKCMNWYNAEPDPDSWLEELSDCPATRRTARRDNRYRRIRRSRDIECYELRWPTRRFLASHQCCYFRRGRRRNAFVSDPPLAGRAYRLVETKSLNRKKLSKPFFSTTPNHAKNIDQPRYNGGRKNLGMRLAKNLRSESPHFRILSTDVNRI